MSTLTTRDMLARALTRALNRPLAGLIPVEWSVVKCSEFLLAVADALIASGAVVDVDTLADEIAGLFPYNGELRPDGSEDPRAAAYVEGLHDAWQVVKDRAERAS